MITKHEERNRKKQFLNLIRSLIQHPNENHMVDVCNQQCFNEDFNWPILGLRILASPINKVTNNELTIKHKNKVIKKRAASIKLSSTKVSNHSFFYG